VVGVVELYKSQSALLAALRQGRWLVVVVSVIGGTLLYLILYSVVRRANGIIDNQRRELQAGLERLSALLSQNQQLHGRVRRASSRAVELNEHFLRRVGTELHDGPAQALGFALLRLDSIGDDRGSEVGATHTRREVETIRSALEDALTEIRAVSAGMVLPELAQLTISEALQKVVRNHEQRTGNPVDLQIGPLPEELSLPSKICAYRFVQEALNNAYRHGDGARPRVETHGEKEMLRITVADCGPGFDSTALDTTGTERLGLRGLRERIESVGGHFLIDSAPGRGTRVHTSLPVLGQATDDG
jgi:signal transduction histidine kinase